MVRPASADRVKFLAGTLAIVNFLAHAAVARRADPSPAFVLGAVLPDLLPMAGVRLDRTEVPDDVAAGWAEHHRADAAFHTSLTFVSGVGALRTDLRATDLTTGPRRAAAHVGWELLLDDAVAGDLATIDGFRAALHEGRRISDDPRWHGLLDRFAAIRPSAPSDTSVIAERVQRACSRRPRLAFDDHHLASLAAVLADHRDTVLAVAPALLDEVASAT
ncbi:MAG: hypothetical protein JWN67_3665 [Actinomycetia bacterium]|nr:hypothetical protein [Actinomycetes bacterium]